MTGPPPAAALRWAPEPSGGWRLHLGGDWRGCSTQALADARPDSATPAPASGSGAARITVDGSALAILGRPLPPEERASLQSSGAGSADLVQALLTLPEAHLA